MVGMRSLVIPLCSWRQAVWVYCLLKEILLVSTDPTSRVQLVSIGDSGSITSNHYPSRCCDEETITLRYDPPPDGRHGYIHLSFNDLDLPRETFFIIYTSESESQSALYPDQPSYKYGAWRRPSISTNTNPAVIHLVMKPASRDIDQQHYAGFNVSYRVTAQENPYYQTTTDLCRPALSAQEGSSIVVKSQPISRYADKWLDCVWLIRVAPTDRERYRGYKPYVRFDALSMESKGHLEIREGPTSISPLLASGRSLSALNQPNAGFVAPSEAFYIRLFMAAGDRHNLVQFVYGVVYNASKNGSSTCPPDTIACHNGWCLPPSHKCNIVRNCPEGEDETECEKPKINSLAATTTTTTTTTQAATPTGTPATTTVRGCRWSYLHECDDGRCVMYPSFCKHANVGREPCDSYEEYCPKSDSCVFFNGETCPGECKTSQRQCNDESCIGSYFDGKCPEDACPSNKPHECDNKRECYSDDDECDDYNTCDDWTDEHDCTFSGLLDGDSWFYIIIVIPMIIVLFIACYKCCGMNNQNNNNNNTNTAGAPTSQASDDSAHPVTMTTSANPSRPQYTAVAGSDEGGGETTDRDSLDQAQLPTYDEATEAQEPPPPSYEEYISKENIV